MNFKPNGAIVWFTDGSLTDSGTGAGMYCPLYDYRFSFSLGKHATVFQAEVYAILMCALFCISKMYSNRYIYICSDSQAALKALNSFQISSKIVYE